MSVVYNRAVNGHYNTKVEYPSRPKEPDILRRPVGKLTAEELASIPQVMAQYEADKIDYQKGTDAYYADQRQQEAQFRADLEEEHGVIGHPKADALFRISWEHGHSSGYAEVANVYDELVELIK